ncbi:hypothetical protein FRACYDRAFT_260262 [Fragilariopsis cylindrus CCMP1102]|uniref:F-box domain-containing protein n=1 Tax=Fragilariopsis cylindrus CCMP1102 TaxID=635003 RepID=A0A1E7FPX9_9STRA|nr:hypothetical protein FRACYDRAFT_260262 [Fragilariopsis cylindrus CCMP1102]|eukprot:OEU20208.1 hypothetical protein FRACYDRAFT_260262 [Fragilariopsis cylindrus CCMP1102]
MKRRVNKNNNRKRKRAPPPPPPPGSDYIASRTRHKIKAIAAKWDLQTPIMIEILNWLDQESLINATLVSKQLHKIICDDGHGIENKISPMIEISPTNGSTRALLEHICYNVTDIETKNKMRRCLHMKVNDADKFDHVTSKEVKAITEDAQMDWILSLDMSLPIRIGRHGWKHGYVYSLLDGLSRILPNLREIDLSNISCLLSGTMLTLHCPHLEKLTWSNSANDMFVLLNGQGLRYSNSIKEIIMNDSSFYCTQPEIDQMSDLENHRDTFIFHHCSRALERVSIRNVKWRSVSTGIIDMVPQDALIKFVRNAPSTLRYFRSDLTQENMTMLRLERSEIELLN